MILKRLVVSMAFAIGMNVSFAQAILSGLVVDKSGSPLPSANVLLLNATDSSMHKGMVTDLDGKFEIEAAPNNRYLLLASMVGFSKVYLPVAISNQKNHSFGTIELAEDASLLNDVVVTADKPMFEQRIDRLVVNVSNSITSAGGTALEVLERSPGIIVNRQAGSIAMGGKQGVLVMINGKIQRIPMSALIQMLAGMTANNIEKIELISNPSAKYDAQGDGGIINIVSKKEVGYGTNGSISASAGYGYYGKSSASLDLNHRTKNFNFFGNYNVTYNKLWQQMDFSRSIENPNQQTSTITKRIVTTPISMAKIGAEWTASKKTTLSTLISGFDNVWNMNANNTSHVIQNDLDSANVNLNDKEINHWKNLMGNLNVNHVFREGHSLSLDADYLYYHDSNPHTYTYNYDFIQSNTSRQDLVDVSKKTPIHMGVVKADYEGTLNKIKFEAGAKATISRLQNHVLVQRDEQGQWVPDPTYTQDYRMKDDVLAAYTNFSGKIKEDGQFQIGLRTEHTDMNIKNRADENIFNLNFWSLFPSAFYSHQIDKNHAINFSYGRRITRPSYQDIAPFVVFIDAFTFFSGNPKLRPTITDGAQVSYSIKELLFSVKYSHDRNYIANFQARVDPTTNKTFYYSANFDLVQTVSTVMSFPLKVAKWWKVQNNFTGMYQQINTLYQDVPVVVKQISGQFNSTMAFTLPKSFSAELSGMYWTPSRFGIAQVKPMGNVSFGIQKKFKSTDILSLNITDIFWTNIYRTSVVNQAINLNQQMVLRFNEPRIVRLTFTKSFGNNTVKSARRSTASEAEQQRVKQ